jgi:threonine synthase
MSAVQETQVSGSRQVPAGLFVRCMDCGTTTEATGSVAQCHACGGLLDAVIDLERTVSPATFDSQMPVNASMSGVWRYRELLPSIPDHAIVSRAEGRTPIYRDTRIAVYAGLERFGLKHEGQNPTGSFKDRGMTVGISHARAVGAKVIACASTGNTSASLASYAAAAEIPALVIIPEGKIASGKLSQTIAHGAKVVQVQGDFDQALSLLRASSEKFGVYLVNSVNPFRLEGQKTIVFEMLEQLDWQAPDVIALPGGNLGNTAAFGKALDEAFAVGLIDRIPRLMTIQAAGAAPFAAYFKSGFDRYEPVVAETVATAIKIGNPASVERARRAIERTSGYVTTVTDDEILEAKALIDRAGIGCEPASAATVAGVRRLVREGVIGPDANVVGVLTGHVLKDADAVVKYHFEDFNGAARSGANRPVTIPAELSALERVLTDALHG